MTAGTAKENILLVPNLNHEMKALYAAGFHRIWPVLPEKQRLIFLVDSKVKKRRQAASGWRRGSNVLSNPFLFRRSWLQCAGLAAPNLPCAATLWRSRHVLIYTSGVQSAARGPVLAIETMLCGPQLPLNEWHQFLALLFLFSMKMSKKNVILFCNRKRKVLIAVTAFFTFLFYDK